MAKNTKPTAVPKHYDCVSFDEDTIKAAGLEHIIDSEPDSWNPGEYYLFLKKGHGSKISINDVCAFFNYLNLSGKVTHISSHGMSDIVDRANDGEFYKERPETSEERAARLKAAEAARKAAATRKAKAEKQAKAKAEKQKKKELETLRKLQEKYANEL